LGLEDHLYRIAGIEPKRRKCPAKGDRHYLELRDYGLYSGRRFDSIRISAYLQ
jgi:hypothetical protein